MGIRARGVVPTPVGPVTWAFTDRTGGDSSGPYAGANLAGHTGDDPAVVERNRAELAAVLGVAELQTMEQVHGRAVARIVGGTTDVPPVADALVTDEAGIGLVAQVADCVPVLLADGESGRIAAVHSGWRGVVAEVVPAAVAVLAAVDPGSVRAWIGPSICPACYEVGDDVRARVSDVAPDAFAVTRSGSAAVDVAAGVRQQLRATGIAPEAIETIPGCTAEDHRLYSYRREGVTGRQAGVIVRVATVPGEM